MKIDAKTEVTATELAAVLGLSARRIQQLAQDGILKAKSRGKYPMASAIQSYMDYRTREKALSQAEIDRQGAELTLKKAKATVAVLHAKELQGKMHRSEDVAAMTEDLVYTIRSMLLALPGRLAIDAANLTDPVEVSTLIRREVHTIMEELSQYQYDSTKYEERVRKRMSWDDIHSEKDDAEY